MSESGVVDVPTAQNPPPVEAQTAPIVEEVAQDPEAAAVPDAAASQTAPENAADLESEQEFLRKMPPEIGALLVMVGVAGVFLPGLIGTPLMIAGAVIIWPKTFEPVERKFAKLCPGPHREGLKQVKRFLKDLNRRFPDSNDASGTA